LFRNLAKDEDLFSSLNIVFCSFRTSFARHYTGKIIYWQSKAIKKHPSNRRGALANKSLFRFRGGGGINDFGLIHEGEDADGGVLGGFRAGVGFA
jgi:hypothetical protein